MKYYNKTSETGNTNDGMSAIISTILIFLMIPCLLFGISFLHLGIRNYRDTSYAKEMGDLRVDGTVTEYDKSVRTDDETESITYAPVFSYEYKDVSYTHKGKYYSSSKSFGIGQKVDIYISTDEPELVYIPEYTERDRGTAGLIILGSLFTLVFVLGLVYQISYRKRLKRQ